MQNLLYLQKVVGNKIFFFKKKPKIFIRGSLTKLLIEKFKLREGVDPQHYGLGVKEVKAK